MGINPITAASMKELDDASTRDFGVTRELLMGYAGRSIAAYILEKFPLKKNITVFAGRGNNGGDGFAAAYQLHNSGCNVKVYFNDDAEALSPESKTFYKIAQNLDLVKNNPFDYSCDLLIDCLTGAGFTGSTRDTLKDKINIINSIEATVVSADIPSGLPADGYVEDGLTAVHADVTLAIGRPKLNCVLYPGKQFCGEVVVIDAGFPKELIARDESVYLFDREHARDLLKPNDDPLIHKGKNGKLLIAGGFPGYEGAVLMTATAAVETGIGLITIITNDNSRKVIAGRLPEAMTLSIDDYNSEEKLAELFQQRGFDAVVIGPGLSRTKEAGKLCTDLLAAAGKSSIKGGVIDADGLFFIKEYLPLKNGNRYILTPHSGEAKALSGIDDSILQNDRLAAVIKIAQMTGAAVLMKGASTITSAGGKSFINTTGNNLLATGGSGDILSGIIGAFVAKGMSLIDAGALAAYIHGRCADKILLEKSFSLKATDIAKNIKAVLSETVFD